MHWISGATPPWISTPCCKVSDAQDFSADLAGAPLLHCTESVPGIATFRGDAAIQSLSERSGHSASRAYRTGFMSTRPNHPPPNKCPQPDIRRETACQGPPVSMMICKLSRNARGRRHPAAPSKTKETTRSVYIAAEANHLFFAWLRSNSNAIANGSHGRSSRSHQAEPAARRRFPIAEVAGFVDVAMAENAGVFAHTKERKPRPGQVTGASRVRNWVPWCLSAPVPQ